VSEIIFKEQFVEVYLQKEVSDDTLKEAVTGCGEGRVAKID